MAKRVTKKRINSASKVVIRLFEKFFYFWGCFVATHPWKVIMATLVVTGLSMIGLVNFNSEADGWKLWLPESSRHIQTQNWKKEHFVEDVRDGGKKLSHMINGILFCRF
jgi:predicted RND superfamily exporter protein